MVFLDDAGNYKPKSILYYIKGDGRYKVEVVKSGCTGGYISYEVKVVEKISENPFINYRIGDIIKCFRRKDKPSEWNLTERLDN